MKLVITIIQDRDKHKVADALSKAGFFFTKIASTGGFLRDGNVTMLVGVEDEKVEQVTAIITENSVAREQYLSMPAPDVVPSASLLQSPVKVQVGGSVIFVVDVEQFMRC